MKEQFSIGLLQMEPFKSIFFFVLTLLLQCYIGVALAAQSTQVQQKLADIAQYENKKEAIAQLDEMLLQKSLSAKHQMMILSDLGRAYYEMGSYEQAIEPTKSALKIAYHQNLIIEQAELNKLLGICYYFLGEYSSAVTYYQNAYDFYQGQVSQFSPTSESFKQNAVKRANLLNNIALAYVLLGKSSFALQSYKKAEALYQQFGSENDKVDVRYNIATMLINLKRYDIAITMLKEIIPKLDQLGDNSGVAKAKADLGVAFKYSGQYELALQHTLVALNYFQSQNNKFETASQLHNIAEIYNLMKQPSKAKNFAEQGVKLSQEINHKKALAGSLQSLAKASFSLGDIPVAAEYLAQSNKVALSEDYKALTVSNMLLSSLINTGLKKFDLAIEQAQHYESKKHQEVNAKLNEQLAKFESEQLAQQVIRLEQNKKLQKLQMIKLEQQRGLILLATILIFVIAFLIYRRQLENRLTNELESRVLQRTQALEFLTQELKQANQVKSQFLANMSHEIRTPLTSIVGQSEAIINGDINEAELSHEVNIIHGNSLHLLELINEILDLSKIEANKLDLELREYDLHKIINAIIDIFSEQANKKGLKFEVKHQLPSPFFVTIDGFRLKQILINLCSNAVKFTEKGHVIITISWCEQALSFSVKDTGIGMSEKQLSTIFELFTQADNSISRRFGGSGLGLYLSNQLALLMSGKIEVESEFGKGSTFVFSMPCQYKLTSNQELGNIHEQEVIEKNYQGKIVLADDHDDNRRLIARILEGVGLEVLCATNGKQAVDLCIEHEPSLALLDIQMPEMDGIEAFRKLRSLHYKKPLFALTANAMSHEVNYFLALGFDGHLKKPIERNQFLRTIDTYYQPVIRVSKTKLEHDIEQVDFTDLKLSFTKNLVEDKKKLLSLLECKDNLQLGRFAHRLAGAAQMFGYIELGQSAQELEKHLKIAHSEDKEEITLDLAECLLDELNLVVTE